MEFPDPASEAQKPAKSTTQSASFTIVNTLCDEFRSKLRNKAATMRKGTAFDAGTIHFPLQTGRSGAARARLSHTRHGPMIIDLPNIFRPIRSVMCPAGAPK
jgi:hypothetical protein